MSDDEEDIMALRFLHENPGSWHLVSPHEDPEIAEYMRRGLIEWRGRGKGYEVTSAGSELLKRRRKS